jgi:hypothetical protein
LKKHSVSVDIRNFKKKSVTCPQKSCVHGTKTFDISVQQEVDVAIVMKAMKVAFAGQLDTLVLLAGDGDFKDLIEFLTETLYKKVWIFGYQANTSLSLSEKASPNCVVYLDKIWNEISEPISASGSKKTNQTNLPQFLQPISFDLNTLKQPIPFIPNKQ